MVTRRVFGSPIRLNRTATASVGEDVGLRGLRVVVTVSGSEDNADASEEDGKFHFQRFQYGVCGYELLK